MWAEYFEGLLNVEEDKEAVSVAAGRKNRIVLLGGLNDSYITKEELQGTEREMKVERASGLDWCAVNCLKSGGGSVIECSSLV